MRTTTHALAILSILPFNEVFLYAADTIDIVKMITDDGGSNNGYSELYQYTQDDFDRATADFQSANDKPMSLSAGNRDVENTEYQDETNFRPIKKVKILDQLNSFKSGGFWSTPLFPHQQATTDTFVDLFDKILPSQIAYEKDMQSNPFHVDDAKLSAKDYDAMISTNHQDEDFDAFFYYLIGTPTSRVRVNHDIDLDSVEPFINAEKQNGDNDASYEKQQLTSFQLKSPLSFFIPTQRNPTTTIDIPNSSEPNTLYNSPCIYHPGYNSPGNIPFNMNQYDASMTQVDDTKLSKSFLRSVASEKTSASDTHDSFDSTPFQQEKSVDTNDAPTVDSVRDNHDIDLESVEPFTNLDKQNADNPTTTIDNPNSSEPNTLYNSPCFYHPGYNSPGNIPFNKNQYDASMTQVDDTKLRTSFLRSEASEKTTASDTHDSFDSTSVQQEKSVETNDAPTVDSDRTFKPNASPSTMRHMNTHATSIRYWTEEEDEELKRLVHSDGLKNWFGIALKFNSNLLFNVNGRQCRDRLLDHVNPELQKGSWTAGEDKSIVEGHALLGNKWVKNAKSIQRRSSQSIKGRWTRLSASFSIMIHMNTHTTSRSFWGVEEDAELKRLVQRDGAKRLEGDCHQVKCAVWV